MNLQRNHYQVLGIPPEATTEDIKKKYRELARKFHPDLAKDKALAQKVFSQINQAYRILVDPERRRDYDLTLKAPAPGSSRQSAAARAPAQSQRPSSTLQAAVQDLTNQQSNANERMLADAETAMIQSDFTSAKVLADQVLAADPRNARALGILGDTLAQMQKPREAEVAYRAALKSAPSSLIQSKLDRLQITMLAEMHATEAASVAATGKQPTAKSRKTAAAEKNGAKGEAGLLGRIFGKK